MADGGGIQESISVTLSVQENCVVPKRSPVAQRSAAARRREDVVSREVQDGNGGLRLGTQLFD